MKIILKAIVALLLLGCLLKMPYGYYQFMRIAVCACFVWLAKIYEDENNNGLLVLCGGLVILFNPFFKIHFVRYTWNVIDVIISVMLLLWIIIDLIKKR